MKVINSPSAKCMPFSVLLRTVLSISAICTATSAYAILASLKTVQPPMPLDLGNYISNQFAAEQLGKALFWDMQVGSDGVQACASCHATAGVDQRTTNMLNPGSDGQFGGNGLGLPAPAPDAMRPNMTVTPTQFPFHRLTDPQLTGDPLANPNNVVVDTNDVMGSQGVVLMQFNDIIPGSPVDDGTPIADPIFNVDGINTRQVTGRNTPSVINAIFNFENFHDGRAHNVFNGNNPFGPVDPRPHLIANNTGSLTTELLRLRQAGLSSQASGPPLTTEMSWVGRSWPKIGKKMLSLKPLAQQQVSTTDSRLGFLSDTVAGA
jgi:cytochrome c peroxidase